MRVLALVAALALLSFAGCLDDDGDDGDPTPTPTQTTGPQPSTDEVTFSETGPFIGCLGDVAPCVGYQAGPPGTQPDGVWFELNQTLWLRPFTTSSDNQLGDTDCYVVDADLNPVGDDFNAGPAACAGQLPVDAAWMFLYSYGEPATTLTLTFPAQ